MNDTIKEKKNNKTCCLTGIILVSIIGIAFVALFFYIRSNSVELTKKGIGITLEQQMTIMNFPNSEKTHYMDGVDTTFNYFIDNNYTFTKSMKYLFDFLSENVELQVAIGLKAVQYHTESDVPDDKKDEFEEGKKNFSRLIEGLKSKTIKASSLESMKGIINFNEIKKNKYTNKNLQNITYIEVLKLMNEAKEILKKHEIEDKKFDNKLGEYFKKTIEDKVAKKQKNT